MMEPRAGIKK